MSGATEGRASADEAAGAQTRLVRVDHVGGGVVHLVLDRPRTRNALSPSLIAQLREALAGLAADSRARVIVLKGAGPDFCAGADLEWMRQVSAMDPRQIARDSEPLQQLYRELDALPLPVIGVAHGNTMAGGLGLLAACDVVVAHRAARFGVTEVRLGLIPALLAPFLMRKIGLSTLRYLAVTATTVDAVYMAGKGLVHSLADDEAGLDQAVDQLVRAVRRASPQAIAMCKAMLREISLVPLDAALPAALDWVAASRQAECARDGIDAFLNRRQPPWHQD